MRDCERGLTVSKQSEAKGLDGCDGDDSDDDGDLDNKCVVTGDAELLLLLTNVTNSLLRRAGGTRLTTYAPWGTCRDDGLCVRDADRKSRRDDGMGAAAAAAAAVAAAASPTPLPADAP
jgi:hypothetical protein